MRGWVVGVREKADLRQRVGWALGQSAMAWMIEVETGLRGKAQPG